MNYIRLCKILDKNVLNILLKRRLQELVLTFFYNSSLILRLMILDENEITTSHLR